MRRTLLLSPHFDDIAFSIGGLLDRRPAALGHCILVTLFSRSDYLPGRDEDGDEHYATMTRVAEDESFAVAVGVETRHGGLPEGRLCGFDSIAALFDGREIQNDKRLTTLKKIVAELVREHRPDAVFTPIGIGGHIEHRLTRAAAEASVGSPHLVYYEDLPYAGAEENAEDMDRLFARLPQACRGVLVPIHSLQRKLELARTYASQVVGHETEAIARRALAFHESRACERIWIQDENLGGLGEGDHL
ncbi:MAG: PIG-L family deacetylase [Phycisphaerales bacterium]|nr:PIG-L family deacetylase [Phycisphaerales bacterium]